MKCLRHALSAIFGLGLVCAAQVGRGSPGWEDSLRAMKLPPDAPLLNRDNTVAVLLNAFQSNAVVKGLLVLPDVSDDFYLIHRDLPKLNVRASNLFDALAQLTNRTDLHLTFREPFLLVHMPTDRLEASVIENDPRAVQELKTQIALDHGVFVDTHWQRLEPRLAGAMKKRILPSADSQDAWHFARHNFAGYNLTGWEFLRAVALTGNTTVTVQKNDIQFQERNGR